MLLCPTVRAQEPPSETQSAIGDPQDTVIERIPKLMAEDMPYYPCDNCHNSPEAFNPTPRKMDVMHTDKAVHFANIVVGTWCHRCHQAGNYLTLHLQNGTEVSLNETYLLCRECHGPQYNDWRKNIHGKRIGLWAGPRQVYSCPECHDPHSPAFKPLKPLPAPVTPRGKSKSFWKLLFGDLIHEQ